MKMLSWAAMINLLREKVIQAIILRKTGEWSHPHLAHFTPPTLRGSETWLEEVKSLNSFAIVYIGVKIFYLLERGRNPPWVSSEGVLLSMVHSEARLELWFVIQEVLGWYEDNYKQSPSQPRHTRPERVTELYLYSSESYHHCTPLCSLWQESMQVNRN